MVKKNPHFDAYITQGCGRCSLGGTPQCKVHSWTDELKRLRRIVLSCNLEEQFKWSMPCYTFKNANVAMIAAFKEYCSLSFFKGVLLKDSAKLLVAPGENSQSARLFRFTSLNQIIDSESIICDYLNEAIELEKSGQKVDFKAKNELEYPAELLERFEQLPALAQAFAALTPGRQRGYVLFFNGAKQSKTRMARIDKCQPQILEGLGLHD